jgi:hypothetical protein
MVQMVIPAFWRVAHATLDKGDLVLQKDTWCLNLCEYLKCV